MRTAFVRETAMGHGGDGVSPRTEYATEPCGRQSRHDQREWIPVGAEGGTLLRGSCKPGGPILWDPMEHHTSGSEVPCTKRRSLSPLERMDVAPVW